MHSPVKRGRILVSVVALALQALASGRAGPAASGGALKDEDHSSRPAVHALCGVTMTNICDDIMKLASQFPALAGLSRTNIVSARAMWKADRSLEYHHLGYLNNVRILRNPVLSDPKASVPASDEMYVVGRGGIQLQIYLLQGDVKVHHTFERLLPFGEGDNQLRLVCCLQDNPRDRRLHVAISEILTHRADQLCQTLRTL